MFSKKNNLYVLRYNDTGNYYVGTATNLEKRMLVHWRRESKLPIWSKKNKSKRDSNFIGLILEKMVFLEVKQIFVKIAWPKYLLE